VVTRVALAFFAASGTCLTASLQLPARDRRVVLGLASEHPPRRATDVIAVQVQPDALAKVLNVILRQASVSARCAGLGALDARFDARGEQAAIDMAWPGMCVEHGLGVWHGFSYVGSSRPSLGVCPTSPVLHVVGGSMPLNQRLGPATIRSALHRRWFEWRLRHLSIEPYEPLTEVGTGREAWMVPAGTINGAWTCYCIGAGSDLRFDLELIRRYGATVRSVDPQKALRREVEPDAAADPRLTVIEATVAPQDGPSEGGETTFDGREAPRSLRSLMEELGDQQVQLLKLNIGGDEYGVLETLDLRALGVRVLLVELHATRRVDEALQLLERLRSQGYRPVHRTRRAGFTFVGRPSLSKHAQ
jgi:hypothetical protein